MNLELELERSISTADTVRSVARGRWAAAPTVVVAFSFATVACAPADGTTGDKTVAVADAELHRSEPPGSALVVEWNQVATGAAVAHDGFQDFAVNLRAITMMHLALHDAINTIRPEYRRYALASGPKPFASMTATTAQAARDVLLAVYPAQQGTLDRALAKSLARVPEGRAKSAGIELGRDAAEAILAARASDGWDATGSYSPKAPAGPGDYQFVPPFDFVFRPNIADAKPFGVDSVTEFRVGPAPELSAAGYAIAYDEVKALGAKRDSTRSEDQSHEAQWWYEYAESGWNRIANVLLRERNVGPHRAARLFALVNMGMADAYVAVWNAKRHYDAWRPYTAIRGADHDGNPRTAADPSWEPFCVTPPVWEYPSAHAMQSAAAAEMLVSALGTDRVSFTMASTTAPPEHPERSFTSLRAAAAEAADSRVMCGIHFRFATEAGLQSGRALAHAILARHLRPAGKERGGH